MSSKVRWGESARAAPGRQRERARKREGGKTKGVANVSERASERDNDTRSLTLVHAQTNAYAQAPTSQLVKNSCGQNVGDELNVRPGGENGRVFCLPSRRRYTAIIMAIIALAKRASDSSRAHAHPHAVGHRALENLDATDLGNESRKNEGGWKKRIFNFHETFEIYGKKKQLKTFWSVIKSLFLDFAI